MNIRAQEQNGRPRELGFLVLALAVHAALLLLPLKSWQTGPKPVPDTIRVQLRALPQVPRMEPPATDLAKAQTDILDLPPPPITKDEAGPIPLVQQANGQEEPTITEREPNPPNARLLRQSLEKSDWLKEPHKASKQLGEQPAYRMPGNWKENAGAPYLAEFENTFNGMTAPSEVEIVDRWLAADGSHRVVVNLPNGETMCGRAEAYNPMQPLVEPIMLFGSCGGGGKRTFSVPEYYKRDR
jgi:hypothetical protein